MNKPLFLLMVIVGMSFSAQTYAQNWHVLVVPGDISMPAQTHDQTIAKAALPMINDAFYQQLQAVDIASTVAETIFERCDTSLCGSGSLLAFLASLEEKRLSINLLILYELTQVSRDGEGKLTLRVRAIDTVSGVVTFSNLTSSPLYKIDSNADTDAIALQYLSELAMRNSQQLAMQISTVKKRYVYKLNMSNFTPQEIDTFAGIALSATDNVKSKLIEEATRYHFLGILLPSKNLTYELSSFVSPSQFREQMSLLFKRMGVEVSSRFIQQDNIFVAKRTLSAYSLQLTLLWALVALVCVCLFYLIMWYLMQRRLDAYASTNKSAKWVRLVKTSALLPVPFLCRAKWKRQLAYWEKRVSQSDLWFDNAHQLLQNHEIESANVFVKKSLEDNASNIAAKALEAAIEAQLSKHHVIEDERQEFKRLISKAVGFAQAGELLKGLEQAYTALALCESHAQFNRPVIDLQIDSTKNLIKRMLSNKAYQCAGIKLSSAQQIIQINCGEEMRIGRSTIADEQSQNVALTLPQDTLSRLHKSILIERKDNGFSIKDTGSTNGLWLQYHLCEPHKEYMLAQMDPLHLSPPDELGCIGFQVKHLESNKTLALSLCQNAILPAVNLASSKSFINPSEYALHNWYLSVEVFYLILSFEHYVWLSESEWRRKESQIETQEHYNAVLKLDIKKDVFLHPINPAYDLRIDGVRIIGSVPVPVKSTLSVNGFLVDISLILSAKPALAEEALKHD